MYRRLSAVLFPVMTLFFIGAIYWGYQEHQEKNSILIKAENQYQRAFHGLAYHVGQLHDQLGDTLAVHAASNDYHRKGLVNVWRLTSEAINARLSCARHLAALGRGRHDRRGVLRDASAISADHWRSGGVAFLPAQRGRARHARARHVRGARRGVGVAVGEPQRSLTVVATAKPRPSPGLRPTNFNAAVAIFIDRFRRKGSLSPGAGWQRCDRRRNGFHRFAKLGEHFVALNRARIRSARQRRDCPPDLECGGIFTIERPLTSGALIDPRAKNRCEWFDGFRECPFRRSRNSAPRGRHRSQSPPASG